MKVFIYNCLTALSAILLLSGVASAEKILFTKHFQHSLFDVTQHAMYSVEVLPDDRDYNKLGKGVIGIIVHNAHDEDVSGAQITFQLKDLASGKMVPVMPEITDKHNGLYVVSGIDLLKEDKRELTITVKKDGNEDSVKFVLPDAFKSIVPKGRYSP